MGDGLDFDVTLIISAFAIFILVPIVISGKLPFGSKDNDI
jgi:hypothetical protein